MELDNQSNDSNNSSNNSTAGSDNPPSLVDSSGVDRHRHPLVMHDEGENNEGNNENYLNYLEIARNFLNITRLNSTRLNEMYRTHNLFLGFVVLAPPVIRALHMRSEHLEDSRMR